MHFEVEQKSPVADLAALEQRLAALGVRCGDAVEQIDLYFAHPARDFAKTDEALRVRRVSQKHVDQKNFVTYKGPKLEPLTKTRRELELPLPDGQAAAEKFRELLELLGFRVVASVHKRRRTGHLKWQGREFEISLDDVEQVGTFVELETSAAQEDLEPAKQALADLAARLQLSSSERRSYLELLLEKQRRAG